MNTPNSKILEFSSNERAPRYTSYPTAPNFQAMDGDIYGKWLAELGETQKVSLYIHIPFCEKLCWFCGCTTTITSKYQNVQNFTKSLLKEIDMVGKSLNGKRIAQHIHFGGGSPTILSPEDFTLIMDKLREYFTPEQGAEIAVEIDPRTVTREKIQSYGQNGVNRISIGVQDFNPQVQVAINRTQPKFLVHNVVKWAQEASITGINMDLIYGLPKQSFTTLNSSLPEVLEFAPDRISLFSYAHVPWLKKHQQLIAEKELPVPEVKLDMFDLISKSLQENGYKEIGLDHFAKTDDHLFKALEDGNLHRNFQGYTTDQSDCLIAFGPSAIGRLPNGFVQNSPNNKIYRNALEDGKLPTIRGVELSFDDKIISEVIENIMCYQKIALSEVIKKHALPHDYFQNSLDKMAPYMEQGIIEVRDQTITVNPEYRLMVRSIAACFDQYLERSEAKFSKVI